MKRLFMLSGMLFALGLLGMASYVARELFAALVLFTAGFTALLLITMACVLVREGAMWLRILAPEWNRAGRDWMIEFAHSLRGRHLWQRWTQRAPSPAAPSTDAD